HPFERRERMGAPWFVHQYAPRPRCHTILAVSGHAAAAEIIQFLRREALDCVGRAHQLAAAVGAPLHLHLALGQPFRPDQDLPRNADEIGAREFRTWTLVEIIVQHVEAACGKIAVKLLAGGVSVGTTLLEIEDRDPERRYRLGPFDAGVVVEGFNDGAHESRYTHPIGAA